jgi:hemoglobin-like flavoprotein
MDQAEEQAAITESLEICAACGEDIVPAVFEQFFAADPQARALMQYSDRHMQGRMMEATLDLFLSEKHLGPGNYLDWELDNHLIAYGATPNMYRSLFASIVDVVRELAGTGWKGEHQEAWQARIERIMEQVMHHPTAQQ